VTATDTAGGGQAGAWPPPSSPASRSATATPGAATPGAATSDPAGREMLGRDRDGGAVARRAELAERAREFARGARADSTWAAYEGKWARFTRWCAEQQETPLPADPLTVARFLTDLAPHWRPATPTDPAADIVAGHVLIRAGLRPSSIAGYLAAIWVAHQAAAIPAPDTQGSASASAAAVVSAAGEVANPARHDAVRRVLAGIRRHPILAPSRRRSALRRGGHGRDPRRAGPGRAPG